MTEFRCLEILHVFSSEEKEEYLERCSFHFDQENFLVHMHYMDSEYVMIPETVHKLDTYGNSHFWIIDYVQ